MGFQTVPFKYKTAVGWLLSLESTLTFFMIGPLKFAVMAVIRESYLAWIRNPALFGVRQLRHKEAAIGYYQPNLLGTLGSPETWKTVQSVLEKYVRLWV